jgi:cell division protein FtsN
MLVGENQRNARRNNRRGATRNPGTPDRVPLLVAFALVAVAVAGSGAWWVRTHRTAAPPAAPMKALGSHAAEKQRAAGQTPRSGGTERFEFYSLLPKAEVPVAGSVARDHQSEISPPPVESSGTYFLQVGAYLSHDDAERMRSRLATLHLQGEIQSVQLDDKVLQRLRIGPIEDLTELNRVRTVLRDSRIEAGLVRVGD